MFRKYLVNIHKFYAQSHGGSINFAVMPAIVAALTISAFFAGFDMFFNEGEILSSLKNRGRFTILIPMYSLVLIIYFYYKKNLPNNIELRNPEGKWQGVILCVISLIFALLGSVYLN